MSVRDLIPWNRESAFLPFSNGRQRDPVATLQRRMNQLIDETFGDFDLPSPFGEAGEWPGVEVSETEEAVRVSAELPGIDEKDVDVMLANGVLSIRGQRKNETKDESQRFSEIQYGRFERRIPVPVEIDEDNVEATFRNGMLTVTLPKRETDSPAAKRIEVKAA